MEMGRIVVSQNMSLDGVVQDPTGEEGFRHGGWFLEYGSEDYEAWAEVGLEEARGAEALLMGRRSDAYFGPRWLSRSGEWADRLNGLPKYVVSSTLEAPRWSNATVLSGEVVNEVAKLKETVAGEIVVVASRQLVHALMEHDLVDELRLMVYPVVLGDGDRLFGETSHKVPVRLVDARTVGAGLAYLTYQVVRDA
jgi:dihydrofolate reductase